MRRKSVGAGLTIVSVSLAVVLADPASARDDSVCEGFRLAAVGARISRKLHCHAWARLTGEPLDSACLDRAEKAYLEHLGQGGPECLAGDAVLDAATFADSALGVAVRSAATESVAAEFDPSGTWDITGALELSAEAVVDRAGCLVGESLCPAPGLEIVCEQDLTLRGEVLSATLDCVVPGTELTLSVDADEGSFDAVTLEWAAGGEAFVAELGARFGWKAEGVFAPSGDTYTGIATVGLGGQDSVWLAFLDATKRE